MANSALLPAGFEALTPYVEAWAIHGGDARKRRRIASTPEERADFYGAALPLMKDALAHLDGFDLQAMPDPERRLLDLMLTLAHISLAIEKQGDNEPIHAVNHALFTITRSTEDWDSPDL